MLPSSALQAPFVMTCPVAAVVHEVPEHLQVEVTSPPSKTGGESLFRQVPTTLSPVQRGSFPHIHTPVLSSVVHRFPVWSAVPQVDAVPHWQAPALVSPVGTQ